MDDGAWLTWLGRGSGKGGLQILQLAWLNGLVRAVEKGVLPRLQVAAQVDASIMPVSGVSWAVLGKAAGLSAAAV